MFKADLFAIFLVGAATITALRQKPATGQSIPNDADRFAEGKVAALDRKFNLTPDQKSKLRPIFLDKATQLVAILNNNALVGVEKGAAIERLDVETSASVDQVITPAQRSAAEA